MPAPGSIQTQTATIAQGDSLSDAVDCSFGTPRMLVTPSDWNYSGGISFQASPDGLTFYDVFGSDGKETTMPMTQNAGYALSGNLSWAAFIKIRAGTRQDPVEQDADRQFTLILQQ